MTRVGARYALRASATRAEGMRIAAWAIQHSLVNEATSAARVRTIDFLLEIPDLTRHDANEILAAAGVRPEELVRRLPASRRERLASELAQRAATGP